MTEELFKQALSVRAKITFCKSRIKWFMFGENKAKNPAKQDYCRQKVKEFTLKLDEYRKEFKALGSPEDFAKHFNESLPSDIRLNEHQLGLIINTYKHE